jgi:flagellar protein FlbD
VHQSETIASITPAQLPIVPTWRGACLTKSGPALRVQGDEKPMIHLTRLNNQPLVVNADLIKFIENAPDTVITLLTGEKLVVRESAQEVLDRIHEFHLLSYRRIGAGITSKSGSLEETSYSKESDRPRRPPEDEKP